MIHPDLGLIFESRSADQVPKNQNKLPSGIECSFHFNQFGLFEEISGNLVPIFLIKVLMQALLYQTSPPFPSGQLFFSEGSSLGLNTPNFLLFLGSLHLSIGSEWEESTASTGTVVTATHIYRNLSSSKDEDGEFTKFYYQN